MISHWILLSLAVRLEIGSATISTDLCGPNPIWSYSGLASSCFGAIKSEDATGILLANQSVAKQRCWQLGARLPQPGLISEVDGLQLMLNSLGIAGEIWIGADNSSGTFTWINGSATMPDTLWLNGGGSSGGGGGVSCISYKSRVTSTLDSVWLQSSGLSRADCKSEFAVVCEKPVAKCSFDSITDFTGWTMKVTNITRSKQYDNLLNIGLLVNVNCKPGFFRARDSPTAVVPTITTASNGLNVNTVLCSYNMTGSTYVTVLQQGIVEQCNPIRCATSKLKTDFRIPYVDPYESQIEAQYFNYSQRFYVNCSRGYVSYANTSAITSLVECGQSEIDPTMGEWLPPGLTTCQPVKCPDFNSLINTEQAWAYKADNRINERQYNEFQSASFPYFPNRVYIKCRTDGYFFDDRSFEKTIGCDLLNGSLIDGAWTGILGTKLTLLKSAQCIEVSCPTDVLIAKTSDGLAKLQALNYKPLASVQFANGTTIVKNASKVNEDELLPYNTVVNFACPDGMDTGTGDPITLCRSSGDWNLSSLPTCTKVTGKLDTKGKFYVPPAVEAAAAGSVGALAITISVLFGISLVMLDLSTLSRDIALMKRNLRLLKRRLAERRSSPVSSAKV